MLPRQLHEPSEPLRRTPRISACLFVSVWQGQLAPPEMVKRTVEDVEKLREQASFTFIFLNNYKLALMAVIPLFGAVQHGFVQFNTGHITGALAANGKVSGFTLASTLLAMPHGMLEYMSLTHCLLLPKRSAISSSVQPSSLFSLIICIPPQDRSASCREARSPHREENPSASESLRTSALTVVLPRSFNALTLCSPSTTW